jgi:hypothetical protein
MGRGNDNADRKEMKIEKIPKMKIKRTKRPWK